ncbi:hypothetical protein KO527_09340 [Pseudoalteromonas sp. C2R02]|uniref:phosphoadenosine phosphosulfate reductase domain-containing protein n=1 Tax=Pseudoalteromonas sp. C2R02 TaxID=2841565 RepID=UPI001C0809C8|nr:phosphoadenosine phosphosulfate reductase family protein [Pseudoalteromonas sp. C2R02]MBU2969546.1 hypothetical protein [Pseudoalteromonas sp. C2R02]
MLNNFERCSKCIQSKNFPKITFDENGVCNFCNKASKSTEIEASLIDNAKIKISDLFDNRVKSGEYDAVVCYSGGKDSTYVLKLAVEKYGLNVLAFTLDNGYIAEAAWKNIRKVVDGLGVDHWVYRPGSGNYKAIARASAVTDVYRKNTLTRISAICNSCISMVNVTALKIALEKKIPFILAGFTLGQIPINAIIYKNHYKFLADSRKESLDKLRAEVGDVVDDYLCIKDELINEVKEYPHNVNILCVEDITETEIKDAIAPLGWVSPGDVDGCSSNCMLNTFNNYVHEEVFGYNPYEMELSHLIREGLMTRSEALEKINDRPEDQIGPIMASLSIDKNDIISVKNVYDSKH